jgi:hypothetical protein
MNHMRAFASLLLIAMWAASAMSDERVAKIDGADFDKLNALIQPCPGESPWREIPWVTNITQARQRAVAEDKPLVIFTAADGSPLGRT